jgi:hypothetical protein
MYITADGGDEIALEGGAATAFVLNTAGPKSVSSQDIQKAGTIFTNTPDGRMRLVDYLSNVEKEIAAEEAARKKDVEAVRAQMARNMAFNQQARTRLDKLLKKKMARNAKIAARNLAISMRHVQARFAYYANLSNKREKANVKRQQELRDRVEKDKKYNKEQLELAVKTQQEAMAALKAKTNKKIRQTNKHVSANAAQIKSDALYARKKLDEAVAKYDKKVNDAKDLAAKGRSKLAAQLVTQDKKIREWANNKLKIVVEKTAAQFNRVREKMAADRQHADLALKQASQKMTASLDAETALENKRFQQSVKDIAAAKAEAAKRVHDAEVDFKTKINLLQATVKRQKATTEARIEALSGVVQKNKVAQAKVNANVDAERKRMVALGKKRYDEHMKKDKELSHLIQKNKESNDARIKAMGAHFSAELDVVRDTMKKNRAHASKELAKSTAKLYTAMAKNQKEQEAKNTEMNAQLQSARIDIANSLRDAKNDFNKRMAGLHETVAKNDRKFQGKIMHLTGVVNDNAKHNKDAREALAATMKANKEELLSGVSDAVRKGEARMAKAEMHLKNLNKKTKTMLNMKISMAINKQERRANSQLEGIRLNSKENRAIMAKEMLQACRGAVAIAKENLNDAVKAAKTAFVEAYNGEAKSAHMDAAARASLSEKIAQTHKVADDSVVFAVQSLGKTLLALNTETRKAISKKNKSVTAYADQLTAVTKKAGSQLSAYITALEAKIAAVKKGAESAEVQDAMKQVAVALKKGSKAAFDAFTKNFLSLASERSAADTDLAAAVSKMNDSIAKQAALADARFSKTVKNIGAARKQAATQVGNARKAFATALANLISTVSLTETKMASVINTATGVERSHSAFKVLMQRRVNAELKRVTALSNAHVSSSVRATGKLRNILNENKRAAAAETHALNDLFVRKIQMTRRATDQDTEELARDVSVQAEALYDVYQHIQLKAALAGKGTVAGIAAYQAAAAKKIDKTKSDFDSVINTMANALVLNAKSVERAYMVLTGVVRSPDADKGDAALLVKQAKIINNDMSEKLIRAVTFGECKGKRVADRARVNVKGGTRALLVEVSQHVESDADKSWDGVQSKHDKIADNYLSLKSYALAARDLISDYVIHGKGLNLSSLGDLLVSINNLEAVPIQESQGMGAGLKELPALFSGKPVAVDSSSSKANGLVDEYADVTSQVRMRYQMGLGKYLLLRLQKSMLGKGVLVVDKVADKTGNYVYINGHAVGLSNKLNDLASLAVRMSAYRKALASLSAKMSAKAPPAIKKTTTFFSPPEWPGN